MLQQWNIRSRAHQCAVSGRPFEEGEKHYTAIYFDPEASGYSRRDVGFDSWAQELAEVYAGKLEDLDLIPGVMAEDLPPGFAFSDTAFRIFILMASRRLNSDRFFTTHFTDEVYTREGMSWLQDNTLGSVLARHCPELEPLIAGTPNAFALWKRTGRP